MIDIDVRGAQQLQARNMRRIAQCKPTGALGRAIRYVLMGLHRAAVALTHVESGALRASHMAEYYGTRGRIYINPATVNPRGQRPVEYGVYEHARGGSHAFYTRAVNEYGPNLMKRARHMIGVAVRTGN